MIRMLLLTITPFVLALFLAPLPVMADDLTIVFKGTNYTQIKIELSMQGPSQGAQVNVDPGGKWTHKFTIPLTTEQTATQFGVSVLDGVGGELGAQANVFARLEGDVVDLDCNCFMDGDSSKLMWLQTKPRTLPDERTCVFTIDACPIQQ